MMPGKADPSQRSDDITQLRQHLGMPSLSYQDISMMVGVLQALRRWPLLGETCAAADAHAEQDREVSREAATS
ncbi:cellulose biosynthesis protein BcsR [Pseudomonas sp. PS01300]|uniref:cellulose biosynthesis protein BcsR n=1 Tax=Pseudomonas sp. PS01300 TaxID=2991436 RepID=UPI00249AAFF1|nr:cellulose biosynthesis protein BcsR [Pseudomonas sp. PS01300]